MSLQKIKRMKSGKLKNIFLEQITRLNLMINTHFQTHVDKKQTSPYINHFLQNKSIILQTLIGFTSKK